MATRSITTSIALDGEKEFRDQLAAVNGELKNLKTEMRYTEEVFKGQADSTEALTAKGELLRKEIDQQEEKVRALEGAVKDAADAYGENDKKTDNWRQQLMNAKTDLVKMQNELKDTEKALEKAEDGFEDCADAIDEMGDEAEDNVGVMDKLQGAVDKYAGLVAGGIAAKFTIEGAKEIIGTIMELEESTREYRRIMDSLRTTTITMEYDEEMIDGAYDRLYGVLGDAQTTATTLSNLLMTAASEEEILQLVDLATGAWSRYGDSIPIDGLAEAINETIRCSQVTGVLADVLNWGASMGETYGVTLKENIEFTELSTKELEKLTEEQRAEYEATKAQHDAIEEYNQSVMDAVTAEDYFNIALKETKNDSERLTLVMQAMESGALDVQAETWRELNEEVIKANESQNRMEQAMGRLGEAVAPAANALRNVGASAIEFLADTIEGAIGLIQDFLEWWGKFVNTNSEAEVNERRAAQRTGGTTTMTAKEAIAIVEGEQSARAQETRTTASMISQMADIDGGGSSYAGTKSGSETINITVTSVLDGKKVGESVTKYQNHSQRAVGR